MTLKIFKDFKSMYAYYRRFFNSKEFKTLDSMIQYDNCKESLELIELLIQKYKYGYHISIKDNRIVKLEFRHKIDIKTMFTFSIRKNEYNNNFVIYVVILLKNKCYLKRIKYDDLKTILEVLNDKELQPKLIQYLKRG